MPRLKIIYCDFFWKALTEDVEELLGRFQQADSVRYEEFSAIWREMGFSGVFRGIVHMSELKRFCRISLATAVKYFLPPYSYQIQVGGLYLMYGFYHTQLALPPVKIRLALKDWVHVQKFLKDSVTSRHYDVVYILQKLIATKAIHYTAMPHLLTFHKQRKPRTEPMCAAFLGRTTSVQELISAEKLEELGNIQSHYEKMKEAIVEENRHIAMAHRDFATRLNDCAVEFGSWQEKTFPEESQGKRSGDKETPTEAESSSRAKLLSSIKNKSYSSYQEASKSRRHRQAEAVDSSGSGAEHSQEAATLQRKRPPSLRARTWKSLGVQEETSNIQSWLLSAPDQDAVPLKRTNQAAPFRW
ncbi:snRNA-activating protein complex subunit 1-like [Centroberyx gerrardi]